MHVNRIEVDPSHRFHCPMTGVLVAAPDRFVPSPATVFLLGPEADTFEHLSPVLEPIWREVRADADGRQSPSQLFEDFCRRLEHHESLVLFSLTSTAIACGPVGTTVHVCIDFAYRADEAVGGAEGTFDQSEDPCRAGDAGTIAAVLPLPRHIPSSAFDAILAAHRHVARDVSGEPPYGPIDRLVGYRDPASGEGFLASESDDGTGAEGCGPPLDRLRNGEKLAIRLHDGRLADGVELIDGKDYRPTKAELRAGEVLGESAAPDEPRLLPEDTGFYAIGVGLNGDRLTIEPIAVGCGMNGASLVRRAVFPESLRRRIAAFLARLM